MRVIPCPHREVILLRVLQRDVGRIESVDASLGRAPVVFNPLDDVLLSGGGADSELVLADTRLGVKETCPTGTDLERGVSFSKYSRNGRDNTGFLSKTKHFIPLAPEVPGLQLGYGRKT